MRIAALLLSLLFAAKAFASPTVKPIYRVTGVAVSRRDAAPVPYCHMQISESSNAALPQGGPRRSPTSARQPNEIDADVHGRFEFTLDHAGAYVLTGSAREYRRQNFDEHERFFSSIVLTPAEPAANVTFQMEKDAAISGLVLDEAGEAVRNAQVVAEAPGQLEERPGRTNRRGGGRQAGFSQTDDRGRYELTGLAPGSYRLRVTAQPWYAQGARNAQTTNPASGDVSLDVVYATQWFPGVNDEASVDTIRLSGGEERQADFHMNPLPAVRLVVPRAPPEAGADGQVKPQRNAYLNRISPAGGGFSQSSSTNDTVEFSGLAPGIYELRSVGPDGRPDPEAKQFRVVAGATGVVDLANASLLTKVTLLFDGIDAGDLNQITFVDSVSGRAVGPDGGLGGRRRNSEQAADREHAVYLAAGKWEVHVGAFGSAYLIGMQATGAAVAGATITIGEQPATLTLHLGSGRAEIAGFAASAGKPVEGAMVLLVPATLGDPGNVTDVQRDQTNSDGSYTLRGVAPGKYILLAIDHGWDVKWHDLPTLASYLAKGLPVEVAGKEKVQRTLEVIEP